VIFERPSAFKLQEAPAVAAAAETTNPYAKLLEGLLEAVWLVDAETRRVVAVNAGAVQLLGLGEAELIGASVESLSRTPEDTMFWIDAASDRRASLNSETLVRHLDGHMLWVTRRISFIDDGAGPGHWLVTMRDQTRQRDNDQARESLVAELRAALHRRIDQSSDLDLLTTLLNRSSLVGRIDLAMAGARLEGRSFALLNVDLDRFKQINDTLGRSYGDRVLQDVAGRLQLCLGESDALARLGGDEYAVLINSALRMQAEMARPFSFDNLDFTVTCSIGIALYPRDGTSADELLASAEQAMHWVKESGRSTFRFHQPRRDVDLLARMRLDHDMRQALTSGQFQLRYQPQVSLGNGQVIGAEALIRWRDPRRGEISPSQFIPVAEESGFILAVGDWVLQRAVEQAVAWWRAGRRMPVAVNVSALQFQQARFVDFVDQTLRDARLPPELLELELTESILVRDAEEGLRRLESLSALGVGMSIDDFGTGYSSLAYLKRFPIQRLKIDRSFIQGLPDDGSDAAIVNAIVQMGNALDLNVIAEGVENESQLEFLKQAGCDEFQGFLFAKALEPAAFEQLVWRLAD
jgi:diguanylate cyclase (GGDEF)-like protein/PAS domain S-box-containing protein